MASEFKLHQARIAGQIQSCFSNLQELTTPIVTKEEFQKSLSEGDVFYEESIIKAFCDDVQKKVDSTIEEEKESLIKKANDEIGSLQQYIVVDGDKSRVVYLKKAQDQNLEKADEGSRGGRIIGHTKSGKPVYANLYDNGKSYKDFSSQDHRDAGVLHHKESEEQKSPDHYNKFEGHSKKADRLLNKEKKEKEETSKDGEPKIKKSFEENFDILKGEGSREDKIINHTYSKK